MDQNRKVGLPISVIVITRNEEANIERCLESVTWADEIVVVDSGSSDRTVEIARRFTPRVFVVDWMGYVGTKEYTISKTRNDWVFWLDADEEVSPELRKDLLRTSSAGCVNFQAFKIRRKTWFMGRWIRHCGWYPDYVVRLFRKDAARFSRDLVHERLVVNGRTGTLSGDLLHYTDHDFEHYFKKFHRYTKLSAIELHRSGVRVNWVAVTGRAVAAFLRIYIFKLGFLDGVQGFQIAVLTAFYIFVKYFKLWELQHNHGSANFRPRLWPSEEGQHVRS